MGRKKKTIEQPDLTSSHQVYLPCEWVIQFDNDEPQVFATADNDSVTPEVTIKLQNTSESHITFTDTKNNKSFRMYARPKI